MGLRIKSGERVEDAVRSIVRDQLDDAIDAARDAVLSEEERVHKVRTRLKRARAALGLIRANAGKKADRDNRKLRDVARSLAPSRDLAVQAKTLHELAGHLGPKLPPKLHALLTAAEHRLRRRLAATDVPRKLRRSARHLKRLRDKLGGWSIEHERDALATGVSTTIRRADDALVAVRRRPSPERFHDWRKRVKALSYQLHIVGRALPGRARALANRLARVEKLAETLGQIHDLDALMATVGAHPRWFARHTADVLALLERRRQRREAAAFAIADEFFLGSRRAVTAERTTAVAA